MSKKYPGKAVTIKIDITSAERIELVARLKEIIQIEHGNNFPHYDFEIFALLIF